MSKFLEDIAAKIIKEHPLDELYKAKVVLPSRRAGLFLRKHLLQLIGKPFLSPTIITINELVEDIAGYKTADNTVRLKKIKPNPLNLFPNGETLCSPISMKLTVIS
jgi:hypothetical protein